MRVYNDDDDDDDCDGGGVVASRCVGASGVASAVMMFFGHVPK